MRFEHSWIKQSEELFFNLFEYLTASDADIDASEVGEFALSAKEIAYFYRNQIREENDVFLPPAKGVLRMRPSTPSATGFHASGSVAM